MSDNVIAALFGALAGSLIGGIFALLTLVVSHRAEAKRRAEDAQSQRESAQTATDQWYAELFITKKLEALTNLQNALAKIRYDPFTFERPKFLPKFLVLFRLRAIAEEIDDTLSNLERARTMADTYLDEQGKALIDAIPPQVEFIKGTLLNSPRVIWLAVTPRSESEFRRLMKLLRAPRRIQMAYLTRILDFDKLEAVNDELGDNILAAIRYISEELNPQALRLYAEKQKPHFRDLTTICPNTDTKISHHRKQP